MQGIQDYVRQSYLAESLGCRFLGSLASALHRPAPPGLASHTPAASPLTACLGSRMGLIISERFAEPCISISDKLLYFKTITHAN